MLNEKDIDNIVSISFKEILDLSSVYDEEHYLNDYTDISYQKEMIFTIVLIHNKEYKKTLDFLSNIKISNFVSNNKCFSDLAMEYINKVNC